MNPYELGDAPRDLVERYTRLAMDLAASRQRALATRDPQWLYPTFDPSGLVLDAANDNDRAHPYFALLDRLLGETFGPYAAGHDGDLGLVGVVGPAVVIHKSAGCGTCGGTVTTDLGVQSFLRAYFQNPDLVVIALNDDDVEAPLSIEDLVGSTAFRRR
ncbi:MAG: NifU family protein [Dehalococcoidia bacterium]|nr:NifU family protein [Dehalococcoidia bacterium]